MFYGWKIVGVTMVTNFISVGFVFYSYGVVFKPIADELGGNRFGLSAGLAIMNIATGLFAPFLGQLLDRWSIRYVMCLGAMALTTGFVIASRMTALWQFYLILATFLGLGAASIGGLPGSTLIANWFERRRGMALGISTMGVSASGMVLAPTATYMIESMGWRQTFLVYAAVTISVVLPVVWFFVVSRPEDLGQFPDGDSGPEGDQELPEPILPLGAGDQMIDHAPHFEWSAISTLRDARFWLIAMSIGLNFFAMSATLTHMIPHVTDLGYSARVAAYVLAASAGVGVLGKLVFGWLTDY
ncbi:MAG: MFS transporter, partial [Candidatus Hydrogenedentota bacterium]